MVREVASKTSDQAGDGTTTATVLAHAIVKEGAKAVAAGMNPMDLKRGIDRAIGAVVDDLKKHSKAVTSNDEIAQVGTISANGDSEIGRFLAEAMKKVGNHAHLQPACPSCGRMLCLTRTTPRTNGLTELRTYNCWACGVWVTEAADDLAGWRASKSS